MRAYQWIYIIIDHSSLRLLSKLTIDVIRSIYTHGLKSILDDFSSGRNDSGKIAAINICCKMLEVVRNKGASDDEQKIFEYLARIMAEDNDFKFRKQIVSAMPINETTISQISERTSDENPKVRAETYKVLSDRFKHKFSSLSL